MSVAQMSDLRRRIVAILQQAPKPLSIPEIEFELKKEGDWDSDTFDVRDAVHQLLYEQKAEHYHPGRLVKLLGA